VIYETRGVVEGEITRPPRGTAGFGYDPIFFYPPYRSTLAEVTQQSKLDVAHRGQAFRSLADWLKNNLG
jgi:XTP/dITP diphosphohydrolase